MTAIILALAVMVAQSGARCFQESWRSAAYPSARAGDCATITGEREDDRGHRAGAGIGASTVNCSSRADRRRAPRPRFRRRPQHVAPIREVLSGTCVRCSRSRRACPRESAESRTSFGL